MQISLNCSEDKQTATTGKLDSPGLLKSISVRLKSDVDGYAVRAYYDPHRWHLGASQIGHACSRYLWYVFRWCGTEKPDGRRLRLFNRGHREEARFIEFIEGIGGTIWATNVNAPLNEKGEHPQFRLSAVDGHFGGSIDGVMKMPPSYQIEEPFLAEFKTNGTGKGFNDVREKQIMIAKPMHWSQVCTYGYSYKLQYVAYFIVNKNNDDLEIQTHKLNWQHGAHMIAKAKRIIGSSVPPPKLSESPTFFDCVYCPMKGPCHLGEPVEYNCRSCNNASPAANAEWHCSVHGGIIPRDFVKLGCPSYKAIQ